MKFLLPTLFAATATAQMVVTTAAQVTKATIELPRCQCATSWPNGDNAELFATKENWGHPYNEAMGQFGWAIDPKLGCQNAGGDPSYRFCVPDTTQGPCVGWANWEPDVKQFFMQCGNDDEPFAPMTPKVVGGAMKMFDYIKEAELQEACKCADATTTAESKLLELYCGPASKGYADGITFNEKTCKTAPSKFSDMEDGSMTYGYKTTEMNQDKPVTEWCMVDPADVEAGCTFNQGGYDRCTTESWMQSPNVVNKDDQANRIFLNSILKGYQQEFNQMLVKGLIGFFPAVLVGDGEMPLTELYQKYQKAHTDLYATQAKPDYNALLDCNAACEEGKKAAKAKETKDVAEEKKGIADKCTANPTCKKNRAAKTSCAALTRATDKALNHPADEECRPYFYFSPNSQKCLRAKQAGEYCNIVQVCADGLTCGDANLCVEKTC